MKAIILAGGRTNRLIDSVPDRPKILLEIGGKSILERQLDLLKRHKINDVRLALGFRADQIIECLKNLKTGRQSVDYVIESEPLGTGGAVKFASQDIKDDFLVINGDVLTDLNLTEFIDHHRQLKQKAARNINSLAAWKCRNCVNFSLIRHRQGRIIEFSKKSTVANAVSRPVEGYINAGFYIFNPEIFANEARQSFSIERDVFPNAVKCGNLFSYLFGGFWAKLDAEGDLVEARKRFEVKSALDKDK
jgi:NDP-sugar pyrophosphorylase family protein